MTEEEHQAMIDRANLVSTYKLEITPCRGDSDDIRWITEKGDRIGYGYRPKNKDPNRAEIALIRCPACDRENYAMNVSSGMCTWCPFTTTRKE